VQASGAVNRTASHNAVAATADHSRYVQRVRRRFAEEIGTLPAGAPDAPAIEQLIDRFVQQGHSLAAALRIARHAVV
jgi:glutamate-ammonia-ligase adenylyltransferase